MARQGSARPVIATASKGRGIGMGRVAVRGIWEGKTACVRRVEGGIC
jgi:hypothetical protein